MTLLQKKTGAFVLFYADCQFIQNRRTTFMQTLFYTFEYVLFCVNY